jgi:hypothetical protein
MPNDEPLVEHVMRRFDDGEPLPDWVSEQLARWGVDVEAMILAARRG